MKIMLFFRKVACYLKRRIVTTLLCVMLLIGCALPVSADNCATYVENISTITSNALAQVTMKVNIHLDSAVENLTFPVPLGAKDVKVNGSSARATRSGGALQVDISDFAGAYAGDYTLRFDFTLENVVLVVDKKLQIELPILCGFAYPITDLDFSVTLPGEVENRPYFTGGYRQSTMESVLNTAVQGNQISGKITTSLVDYETLTMTLEVPQKMFPSVSTYQREGNPEVIPMLIVGAVGLLFWLIFLRTLPLIRSRRTMPPEGVSAGEMGCRLTFSGADLTSMVFSWAQLGYILIHVENNGRIILHKRMEMGNERSLFEVKTFKLLFGNRRAVDGTGTHYARLAMKIARQIPGEKILCNSSPLKFRIFRVIHCIVLAIGGVCYAMNLTELTVLRVLLSIVFGIIGVVCAWCIQSGMYRIHLCDRRMLWVGIGCAVIWCILGAISGAFLVGLISALWQMAVGCLAAYGGRRTEMGRTNAVQIISFRHYLKHISKKEVHELCIADSESFFRMLPYALALNVEDAYAKCFLRYKLPTCPYLILGNRSRLSAQSWARQARNVADALDSLWHQMEIEKFAVIRVK